MEDRLACKVLLSAVQYISKEDRGVICILVFFICSDKKERKNIACMVNRYVSCVFAYRFFLS